MPTPLGTVTLERWIAARPETVFSFFTDRERWLSWMGTDGTFSFEPGGDFRTNITGDNHAAGRFLEFDPPRRVVFTWGWESGGMPIAPGSTTVEITLKPDGDGTLLQLAHRDLPAEAVEPHTEGWTHYMDRLAARAEGADPGADVWQ